MGFLRNLTLGFGSGVFGVIVFVALARLLAYAKVPDMLGIPPRPFDLAAGYRLAVWGGIWGLLLALPFLRSLWWLRGLILGVVATAAIPLYFNPNFAKAAAQQQIYALVLNSIWGLAAAFWYRALTGLPETRRFGLR